MNTETLSEAEIDKRFTYHKPIGNQPARYEIIRDKAKGLARLIRDLCPDSRERMLALLHLENTVMWANAAIARNENEATSVVTFALNSPEMERIKKGMNGIKTSAQPIGAEPDLEAEAVGALHEATRLLDAKHVAPGKFLDRLRSLCDPKTLIVLNPGTVAAQPVPLKSGYTASESASNRFCRT